MSRDPVAKRYAQALFIASEKRDLLQVITEDLKGVLKLLNQELGFRRFLSSPRCTQSEMAILIKNVFAAHVHALTLELFKLLLSKKRLPILDQIITEFLEMIQAHQGIIKAEITAAVPVSDAMVEELVRKLEAGTGKTVIVESKVDPTIIAGMMVRLGDQIIDRSARRMLTELREHLMSVSVDE